MGYYLGIDVGSITTKLVMIDEREEVLSKVFLRNSGRPIEAIQKGIRDILVQLGDRVPFEGAGHHGQRSTSGRLPGGSGHH